MPENKKLIVFGSNGMLGSAAVEVFSRKFEIIAHDIDSVDICDNAAVEEVIALKKPSLILNCAAYTDVDGCEKNRGTAFRVNAEGPRNIAVNSSKYGARVIHISTDYIFDGQKSTPYTETDTPSPINVYGSSKLEGEKNVMAHAKDSLIVRTSWLYGPSGKNFVSTLAELPKNESVLKVVRDQKGKPTYTYDLAEAILNAVEKQLKGIVNICNSGECSWYEFAVEIFNLLGRKISVNSASSEEYKRPAARPKNSVLSMEKYEYAVGLKMRSWEEALKDYLKIYI
ncbi:MAG: dTDP-4-dehydrorhamnose reductase [Candidatus Aureabacteria bacterium]|nr:dTDP-4-dehydrorhamnose reductase [Candidatus Auribacterota bacterium]